MTELDKLKRARMYIEKMARGINPIDNTPASENDTINNLRVSRCLFYVSDVLGKVIDNQGEIDIQYQKSFSYNAHKPPFAISDEALSKFEFSAEPISVSEIVAKLNRLAGDSSRKKLTTTPILKWLVEIGMLSEHIAPSGRAVRRPTEQGRSLGIITQERAGKSGTYTIVLYSPDAQQFVIDNIEAYI